jgi:cadmium resistance protein CadD (predicted permease)
VSRTDKADKGTFHAALGLLSLILMALLAIFGQALMALATEVIFGMFGMAPPSHNGKDK